MADAARSVLVQIVSLAVLAGSCLVFGRAILWRVKFPTPGERNAFALGAGLGICGWSLFLLGLAGLLKPAVLIALFVAAHAASLRVWRTLRSETGSLRPGPVLFAILFALPSFILSLYPPTAFDETMYHLPYARLFARQGAVVFAESLRFPVFPQLANLVFTPILMLAGAEATHVVQFFSAAATAFAAACWARQWEGGRASLWTAAIWIGNPIVVWFAATSYIDLSLTLFAVLAFRAVALWSESGARSHIVLAGAMCGFAAGTKYHGLLILAVCALCAVVTSRRSWRAAAWFLVAVVLAMGPFYVRNAVATGNPVFPFFGGVFGQSAWSTTRLAPSPEMRLETLIELPWTMVADAAGRHGQPPYSPLSLMLLPLAVIYAARRPSLRWAVLATLLYAVLTTILIRDLPTDVRYLFPVVAVFAVPAGAALHRSFRRFASPTFGFLVAVILALPGLMYGAFKIWERGPVPVTAPAKSRFLARMVPAYPLIEELNRRHGNDYSIYTVFGENLRWYVEGRAVGDRLGPGRYRDLHNAATSASSLARFLKTLKVDYILLDRTGFQLPRGKEFVLVSRSGQYEVWRVQN